MSMQVQQWSDRLLGSLPQDTISHEIRWTFHE